MGRWCTILGVLVSIGTAYMVMEFKSIMDYVQALFSFFIAPLFGTVLLGMLWKRATPAGGFWGLLRARVLHRNVGLGEARIPPRFNTSRCRRTPRIWPKICIRGLWSWIVCVIVTVVVSLMTRPKPDSRTDRAGVRLYGDPVGRPRAAVPRPIFWAVVVRIGVSSHKYYFLVSNEGILTK